MRNLIIIILVIAALCYFGVLKFNRSTAEDLAKKGVRQGVELTKKGANVIGKELQKASE